MSTPQLEDGHVRIANELFEAILAFGFSQRELLVMLTVIRKTYGFNKKTDDMSASQIGDLCKVARPHVTATLNQLAQRNVITKRAGRFGSIVGIQKDYRKWVSTEQINPALDSTDSVQGCTESVRVPNEYGGSTDSVQVGSTDAVHTKDTLPTDNHQKTKSCTQQADSDTVSGIPPGQKDRVKTELTDEVADRFERFYAAYPKKQSRGRAEKAFAKLAPSEELLAEMLVALRKRTESGTWIDPQFVPHPTSWLNDKRWLDVLQAEYTPVECEVIDSFNELLGTQLGEVSPTIFVPSRAALIAEFLTFSKKDGLARRYFTWLRDENDLPPMIGFDRLIGRQGYADAIGGKFSRKAA